MLQSLLQASLRNTGLLSKSRPCVAMTGIGWRGMSGQTESHDQQLDQEREKMARKLLYRSKQRGFLELDLLVGLWAEKEIPRMDMNQLHELTKVLDEENPDLFKWLTGQLPAPQHLLDNPAFMSLKQSAAAQLEQRSYVPSRAPSGKDWVRGWDDGWRKQGNATASQ